MAGRQRSPELERLIQRDILQVMIGLGLGLLASIFLSFGCLIAAFNSLVSIRHAYDHESRLTSLLGFFGGIIASAFFGWLTIRLLNSLDQMQNALIR